MQEYMLRPLSLMPTRKARKIEVYPNWISHLYWFTQRGAYVKRFLWIVRVGAFGFFTDVISISSH